MSESYNLPEPRKLTDFPFVERIGLELLHAERGRCVVRLPHEININHVGMTYAGALFSAAEIPGGILFASAFDLTRFYPIVGEMSIRFARPALTDVTIDARMADEEIARVTAELEADGRSRYVLTQQILDTDGTVVATTEGVYFGRSF